MKTPIGILDVHGQVAEGKVVLHGKNGEPLLEFGPTLTGNQASCYVLTSPGDIITVNFEFKPGVVDFVDLKVDGILRESKSAFKSDKTFRGVIKKVCQHDRMKNGRRAAFKFSKMVVQSRSTQKGTRQSGDPCCSYSDDLDITWNGVGSPSEVSSLELQLFQRDLADNLNSDAAVAESEATDTTTKDTVIKSPTANDTIKDATTKDTTTQDTTTQDTTTKIQEATAQATTTQDTSTQIPRENFTDTATQDLEAQGVNTQGNTVVAKDGLGQSTTAKDTTATGPPNADSVQAMLVEGAAANNAPPFVQRAPTIDDYASWSELNCHIDKSGPVPPFEIGSDAPPLDN